jgi:hypothetical protein
MIEKDSGFLQTKRSQFLKILALQQPRSM